MWVRVQCRCSVRGRGREWGFRKGGRQAACNGSAALRRGQAPFHLHAVVEESLVVGSWQVGSGSVRFGGWQEDGSGYRKANPASRGHSRETNRPEVDRGSSDVPAGAAANARTVLFLRIVAGGLTGCTAPCSIDCRFCGGSVRPDGAKLVPTAQQL